MHKRAEVAQRIPSEMGGRENSYETGTSVFVEALAS